MEPIKLKAYYLDDLEKFGSYEIIEKVTVRGLGLSRKTIQKAYKEMRYMSFKGDIIDYLCYVCLLEATRYIRMPAVAGISDEKILNFLYVYLNSDTITDKIISRLLLKNGDYLKDALYYHNLPQLLQDRYEDFYKMIFQFFMRRAHYHVIAKIKDAMDIKEILDKLDGKEPL